MEKENDDIEWMPLYEYDDYVICANGEIKSKEREGVDSSGRRYTFSAKALKPRNNRQNPHVFVEITYELDGKKKKKTVYLHRAVADHFLDAPREDQKYILHRNRDYTDNRAENLKWATKEDLAAIHHKTRKESTRRTWITRRKLYGESGIKSTEDESKSK